MIDLAKHSMHLGSGDVDIDVLESASGTPVIAFTNQYEDLSPANSFFLGFSNGESIDSMIAFLRNIRRTYYPQKESSLSSTQKFRIYVEDFSFFRILRMFFLLQEASVSRFSSDDGQYSISDCGSCARDAKGIRLYQQAQKPHEKAR